MLVWVTLPRFFPEKARYILVDLFRTIYFQDINWKYIYIAYIYVPEYQLKYMYLNTLCVLMTKKPASKILIKVSSVEF